MLTCFQGYLCFYKFFEKLTEITFLFAFLSNKISFLSYSIFNLLFPDHSQGSASAIACILYHKPFCLVKHFFELFQSFLTFFQVLFVWPFRLTFCLLSRRQLAHYITNLLLMSSIFLRFFQLFWKFFIFFRFSTFSFRLTTASRRQLVHSTTFLTLCQLFFHAFLKKFYKI